MRISDIELHCCTRLHIRRTVESFPLGKGGHDDDPSNIRDSKSNPLAVARVNGIPFTDHCCTALSEKQRRKYERASQTRLRTTHSLWPILDGTYEHSYCTSYSWRGNFLTHCSSICLFVRYGTYARVAIRVPNFLETSKLARFDET